MKKSFGQCQKVKYIDQVIINKNLGNNKISQNKSNFVDFVNDFDDLVTKNNNFLIKTLFFLHNRIFAIFQVQKFCDQAVKFV